MKFITFFVRILSNEKADKTVFMNIADSYTGNEMYWNPSLKKLN